MDTFYAAELSVLREEAAQFAAKYPALAPMLASRSMDPDVERFLEGAAYLCSRIHKKLDENAPRLLQSLLHLSFPQALLPLPSSTLVRFTPSPGFNENLHVPAGTELAARPVDGVSCVYTTDHDLTISPIAITGVNKEHSSKVDWVAVTLSLRAARPLASYMSERDGLVLHLAGDYATAAQRFFTLLRQTEFVSVRSGSTRETLPAASLRRHFFPLRDPRLPGNERRNRSYMEMLHYFHLPEQLLFLSLHGLWQSPAFRAEQADITFYLGRPFERVPAFDVNSFALNVVPASNIVTSRAEPVLVDHTLAEHRVRPEDRESRKLETLGVQSVSSQDSRGRRIAYTPYETFRHNSGEAAFRVRFEPTALPEQTDYLLSLLYTENDSIQTLEKQVLSIKLLCCNHSLPDMLHAGDICLPTDTAPSQAFFVNITKPSAMHPRLRKDLELWLFLSHISTNLLAGTSAELLRAFLGLYIYDDAVEPEVALANQRRCASIRSFASVEEDRLVRGRVYRGRALHLELEPSGFVSEGDLFLFASSLDRFFGGYTTVNNYCRLILKVAGTGERMEWPMRLGERQLR